MRQEATGTGVMRHLSMSCRTALGIAIGTGFVAGLAAPVVATSHAGAALLSTTANVAQYALTQRVTG